MGKTKFVDKVAGVLGFSTAEDLEDEYEEEYEDEYEEEEQDTYSERRSFDWRSNKRQESSRPSYSTGGNNGYGQASFRNTSALGGSHRIVNLNANVQMKVIVTTPESFDEAREIAQHIKEKRPVVINVEYVEHKIAQRITDFLCGCCCAVDGNIQRISDRIFMIAPNNVDFDGDVDIRETLEAEGGLAFPWGIEN